MTAVESCAVVRLAAMIVRACRGDDAPMVFESLPCGSVAREMALSAVREVDALRAELAGEREARASWVREAERLRAGRGER